MPTKTPPQESGPQWRGLGRDVTGALGFAPYDTSNPAGYITALQAPVQSVFGRVGIVGMLAADVTGALGFTPYNAANPASYINAAGAPVQSVFGRTGAVALTSADVTGALAFTPYDASNPAGYITAAGAPGAPVQSVFGRTGSVVLTSADVTSALTFAPYNATNPAGYVTAITAPVRTVFGRSGAVVMALADVTSALGFTPYNATNPSSFINAAGAPVQSVFGRTGAVAMAAADVTSALGFTPYNATNPSSYITANVTGAFSATGSITSGGFVESVNNDTRFMMRGGGASKSCSFNFGIPYGDPQGSFTIQKRAATGDSFEAALLGINLTTGNATFLGTVTSASDIRGKGAMIPIDDIAEKLASIDAFTYTDIASGERRIGVSAQSVQPAFPEAVLEANGALSVAYGNLALAGLVEYVKATEKRIAALEAALLSREH